MENENLFEKVLYLSKVSLDIVLLQYKLIHELIDKLEKYEDVEEYKKLVEDLASNTQTENEEKKEETEDAE